MVKIWKFVERPTEGAPSFQLETSLEGHTDWVRDVKWAPNIGLPFTSIASCGQDGKVLIWTQATDAHEWNKADLPNFGHPVWRLSWSELGTTLAVSASMTKGSLWRQDSTGEWVCASTLTNTGE
eukprot:NODE_5050_length_705_cov_26.437716_g4887_i0.p1 GENE.NODE_5050_length_705_cov_26.437716_g4887_i0~~NODE_5050_length_705_cov_26.437716_g4887_i0.p1  ORF type:complete len:124 (+),score=15.41 NODE_5050_length_705_cov_26.437716_g4887_i0:279-650(+)